MSVPRAWAEAGIEWVECLPNVHEALGSVPSMPTPAVVQSHSCTFCHIDTCHPVVSGVMQDYHLLCLGHISHRMLRCSYKHWGSRGRRISED